MYKDWGKSQIAYWEKAKEELVDNCAITHYKKGRTCSSQILPFYFFYPVYFLISAVSTMNFTLPVSPLCKPLKVW